MIKVTILGSGNVGFHLINIFDNSKKIKLHEWYSRSLKFDSRVNVVNQIEELSESDIYVICVNDDSIAEVSDKILSEGKSINYEGATGVEFDKVGDTFGSFLEVDFNKGRLKSKKLR